MYLNMESNNLEEELGVKKLNSGFLDVDNSSRLGDDSLGRNSFTFLIGLSFEFVVCSNTVEEIDTRG